MITSEERKKIEEEIKENAKKDHKTDDVKRASDSGSIELAKKFLEEYPHILKEKGSKNIYYYNYNNKIYELFEEHEFECLYNQFITKYDILKSWKLTKMREILKYINSCTDIEEVEFDKYNNLINLKNGILDIDKDVLIPHSPKYYFTSKINIDYDSENKNAENFVEFIRTTFKGEDHTQRLVLELGGYLLAPHNKAEKLFLFDGDGGTGKSTLINIYKLLFDQKQVSPLSLEQIASGGFENELLLDSRLNVCAESKKKYLDVEEIKKIVTQDDVSIQRKYKSTIKVALKTKIVVACNGLPRFSDTSDGIYRRIIILKFNHQFKEDHDPKQPNTSPQDRNLFDKIKKEAPAILNLFLMTYKKLQKSDWKFTQTKETKQLISEHRRESDTIRWFLEDNYTAETGNFISVESVLKHYRDWYKENVQEQKSPSLRTNELGKRIVEVFKTEADRKYITETDLTTQISQKVQRSCVRLALLPPDIMHDATKTPQTPEDPLGIQQFI